jgi:hypothetical protein
LDTSLQEHILGPLGLGSLISRWHAFYWFTIVDASNVSGIAELGIEFLFFVIGLELSLDHLSSMRMLVGGMGNLSGAVRRRHHHSWKDDDGPEPSGGGSFGSESVSLVDRPCA